MNELVSINGSLEDEFLFATPLKKHVCTINNDRFSNFKLECMFEVYLSLCDKI